MAIQIAICCIYPLIADAAVFCRLAYHLLKNKVHFCSIHFLHSSRMNGLGHLCLCRSRKLIVNAAAVQQIFWVIDPSITI